MESIEQFAKYYTKKLLKWVVRIEGISTTEREILLTLLVKPFKYGLPSLYCALVSRRQKWIFTRYISSYLLSIGLAFLFWEVFIRNLQFSVDLTYGSLTVLIIILGLGFVFTTATKCIAFLTAVGLLGKSGRGFLRALCVTYIVSGPISNLAQNGQEIVRVFACTSILTYNLTKTRFDLMTKPFQNTLASMKDDVAEIRQHFEHIEDVILPIKNEIEGDNFESNTSSSTLERFIRNDLLSELSFADPTNETNKKAKAENIQRRYSAKMQLRCKEQLQKGEDRCKDAFSNANEKCMEELPTIVNVLLCWPLKIDYVCNMKLLGYSETGGICDPSSAIDPKLGENMLDLEETESDLFRNETDVKISYEIVRLEQPPQLRGAEETAKIVIEEFNRKKKTFDHVLHVMQNILSFIFLRVIHSSIVYHKNYLTKIDHDNFYITPYFKKIDGRRKEAQKHSILPIKKFERQFLVDPEEPSHHTKEEAQATTFFLLQFLFEITISALFLFLDHMVVVLLKIIASKAEITYYQEGEHMTNVHINGTGLLARLMRKTLRNFNMHERISTILTNEPCLPRPTLLTRRYYLTLLGIYIATLLLIYCSSVAMRCRRCICSFFYPKREKHRILYLYNKMLKQRKSTFEMMYSKVKDDLEAHRMKFRLNLFLWLRLRMPKYFKWLRWFQVARRNCLICREPEPRNSNDPSSIQFVECPNQNCNFIYCQECWDDVEEVCIACQKKKPVLKYCIY